MLLRSRRHLLQELASKWQPPICSQVSWAKELLIVSCIERYSAKKKSSPELQKLSMSSLLPAAASRSMTKEQEEEEEQRRMDAMVIDMLQQSCRNGEVCSWT
jgi:hypothetical protein